MPEYGLGRWHAPDDRDEAYPLRAAIPEVALPAYRYWSPGTPRHLNQGDTPQCVGFSWKRFLLAAPLTTESGPAAEDIYHGAQRRDEWPGEDYDGSSVRGGVKYLQELGHVAEYRWSWSAEEIMAWVLLKGPVVVGTDWLRSMFTVGGDGFIRADPASPVAGGHAYTLIGANRKMGALRILNSWGARWGESGRAWISGEDMQWLMDRQGEACSALEVPLT